MKPSELTGIALDWAVAKCEGLWISSKPGPVVDIDSEMVRFHPSTDWSQGGPIIEREGIMLEQWKSTGFWQASNALVTKVYSAETPLIAAMRCYVASKLGDNVDLPEKLK